MSKLGLVYFEFESEWISCQSIQKNLISTYEILDNSISKFALNNDDFESHTKIAESIIQNNLSHLAFIDHRLFPFFIINYLASKKYYPIITIHIYGDFFLNLERWKRLENTLKNFKINFICASTAQTKLVSSLLIDSSNVQTLPFPVSPTFKFDKDKRKLLEKKYSTSDKLIILYTGRISFQKNVLSLILAFSKQIAAIMPNAELYISGEFDDIALPYFGLGRSPFSMQQSFYQLIDSLDPDIKSRIKYLGNLGHEELTEYYMLADAYISLSTHNDEDYGMSPAEALVSGLPLILSNWGGFASFKEYFNDSVQLINVEKEELHYNCNKNLNIVSSKAIKTLLQKSDRNRDFFSDQAILLLSPAAISDKLKNIIFSSSQFKGFNNLFKLAAEISDSSDLFGNKRYSEEDYKKIYNCYINPYGGKN